MRAIGNYNRVILLGNCTKDIEIKYGVSGTAYATFGMAMNRKWTNQGGESQEEVCFVDVKAFGRTAEIAGQYLKKGSPVFIEGRLSFYQWEDEETGAKRSKHSVVVESLQLLPRGGNNQGQQERPEAPQERDSETRETVPDEPTDDDDDVPFS